MNSEGIPSWRSGVLQEFVGGFGKNIQFETVVAWFDKQKNFVVDIVVVTCKVIAVFLVITMDASLVMLVQNV